MARQCSVCVHPERAAIETRLVNGTSYRDIAGQFRVTHSAVGRHAAEHIAETITQARQVETVARADDLLSQVQNLRDRAFELLSQAERSGDIKSATSALREARGCVELLAKVAGQINDSPTVNVLVSPDWTRLRSAIVAALAAFPEARRAVAGVLEHQP